MSGAPRRGQRSRTTQLSREAIVACALELIQREGPAALTMRRIGTELGVDPTAFYRHFREKDDLVLACMDEVLALAFDAFAESGGVEAARDWREALRSMAHHFYATAQRFPAITALGFARVTGGPGERRWVEFILATLRDIGLPPEATVVHYRAFVDAMLSLAGLRTVVQGLPADIAAKDEAAWSRIYGGLPHEQFPATRQHARELAAVNSDEIFTLVIDAVLTSIELTTTQGTGGR